MEMRLLTAKEAADFLRTTPENLANMRIRGEGPSFIKQKRKCIYYLRDIEEWLNDAPVTDFVESPTKAKLNYLSDIHKQVDDLAIHVEEIFHDYVPVTE